MVLAGSETANLKNLIAGGRAVDWRFRQRSIFLIHQRVP